MYCRCYAKYFNLVYFINQRLNQAYSMFWHFLQSCDRNEHLSSKSLGTAINAKETFWLWKSVTFNKNKYIMMADNSSYPYLPSISCGDTQRKQNVKGTELFFTRESLCDLFFFISFKKRSTPKKTKNNRICPLAGKFFPVRLKAYCKKEVNILWQSCLPWSCIHCL